MKSSLFILLFFLLLFATGYIIPEKENEPIVPEYQELPLMKDFLQNLRDTLYTEKNSFVEVNLATQMAYLHQRNGSVIRFKVSSGTEAITDGILTREGLYVIQTRSPKQISVQFNNAVMLHWMGFNYGIGFHGLLGNGYYQFLGVKPSSHGCLRVSREDAEEVYSKTEYGTPVLIHSGKNAVTLAFTKENDKYMRYTADEYKSVIMPQRLQALYNGKYFYFIKDRVKLDFATVSHRGLPLGDAGKIPEKQEMIIFHDVPVVNNPDLLKYSPYMNRMIADSIKLAELL